MASRLKSVRLIVRFSFGIPENAALCFLCPSETKYRDTFGTECSLSANTVPLFCLCWEKGKCLQLCQGSDAFGLYL